ncbi:hypothetical protein DMC30DRAFT_185743 [Rhodotorula diobovata]|uniref:C2H2-type domain-containing protein n=1 Tax=Rhodotorula diobovata TaxID=5288 RepID=A0A5C5G162_9BASI|nr:hypothetical protein DMC30DRAFT_185743 [Rhodotorula diobovata]
MPAPVQIARRESHFSPDMSMHSPLLHPALSTSLSKSFGLNSPFSLAAMSTSLKDLSSSPGFSSMAMSLGRSFEERPKIEAQFFKNFTCCGLDLQDLHGLLEHFEECHVAFDDEESVEDGGMDGLEVEGAESEGTISGPPSPRLIGHGPRGFELKKSGLSSFETPDSPATAALHLDSGMELDMDMGEEDAHSPASSAASSSASQLPPASSNGYPQPQAPAMSAFENPLPLQGSASKRRSPSINSQQAQQPSTIPPSIIDIGSQHSRASSSNGGGGGVTTPGQDEPPNPAESALGFLPNLPNNGTVNPAQALGAPGGGSGGLAPSLLFPGTPQGSPPAEEQVVIEEPQQHFEAELEEEEEEDEDDEEPESDTDSEPDEDDMPILSPGSGSLGLPANLRASPVHKSSHSPSPGPSSSSSMTPHHHKSGSSSSHHKPKKSSSTSAAAAAAALAALPPHPIINPHDPATISALANTTLKDPIQTAAAIAALGPNSLAALPTALHPLGQGVQISPSGRPYTPPSEKPFKCNVPGCDKSYKQQNGLKYHRLHGHCGANAAKDGVDPRNEGKPYVCHVASCGKRYKNMNGLRYHYQHSGAHGALGLQMLAQGCHPPPQFPPGHKRGNGSSSSSHQLSHSYTPGSASSSRASSPAGIVRGIGGGGY